MPIYDFQFVFLDAEGNVNNSPYHKIGFEKYDIKQRAVDGWWDCSHPEELCGKLDIRSVKLVRVWNLDKQTEVAAHKYMRGGTLKRKAHNEFYIEGENYEQMVEMLDSLRGHRCTPVSYTHLRAHET